MSEPKMVLADEIETKSGDEEELDPEFEAIMDAAVDKRAKMEAEKLNPAPAMQDTEEVEEDLEGLIDWRYLIKATGSKGELVAGFTDFMEALRCMRRVLVEDRRAMTMWERKDKKLIKMASTGRIK